MAKVLKYIGKGEWLSIDESEIQPDDKIMKIQKKKLSKNEKIANVSVENHKIILAC